MSSKLFSGAIVGVIVLVALAVIQCSTSNPEPEAGFIPISVLADGQADYGIDEVQQMLPSISLDIIADKLQDEGKTQPSLPVIFFTSGLPSHDNEANSDEVDEDLSGDRIKDKNENEGNNGIGTDPGNGNGDGTGNGNGQGKEKGQQKGDNGKGNPQNGNQNEKKGNGKNDKGKGKP